MEERLYTDGGLENKLVDDLMLNQQIETLLASIQKVKDTEIKKNIYKEVIYLADMGRKRIYAEKYTKILAENLFKLAECYADIVDKFSENILTVSILYNAALIISNKINQAEFTQIIIEKLKQLEKIYNPIIFDEEKWRLQYESNKKHLDQIKKYIIDGFPESLNCNSDAKLLVNVSIIKEIYQTSAEKIKLFLIKIIKDCEVILPKSTEICNYCFISFGSLAKGLATPYSDIEFGILIERECPETRQYLKELMLFIGLRIINIGHSLVPKTLLQTDKGAAEIDDLLDAGLQLDLGGKTPLGRKDRDYSLIQTPENMTKYISFVSYDKDRHLPLDLLTSQFLYGQEILFNQFKKIIQPDMTSLVQNNFLLDMTKLNPRITDYNIIGQLFDFKKDLYRLPTELLIAIAIHHKWIERNPFEIAIKLEKEKIIEKKAREDIEILLLLVTYGRLQNYHHYQKQYDVVSAIKTPNADYTTAIEKVFSIDENILFRAYFTLIPFYQWLRQGIFNKNSVKGIVRFFDDSSRVKGQLYLRLMNYEKAIDCLTLAIRAVESNKQAYDKHTIHAIYENLAQAYSNKENYEDALKIFIRLKDMQEKYLLKLVEPLKKLEENNYLNCLGNIAGIYFKQNKYSDALVLYQKIQIKRQAIYINSEILMKQAENFQKKDLINDLLNIAITKSNVESEKDNAYIDFERILEKLAAFKMEDTLLYANCVLSMLMNCPLKVPKELEEKAYLILNIHYGNNHPNIIRFYNIQALKYKNKQDYFKKIECLVKVFEINSVLYGSDLNKENVQLLSEIHFLIEDKFSDKYPLLILEYALLLQLADMHYKITFYDKAIKYAHAAIGVALSKYGSNDLKTLKSILLKSNIHLENKDYENAKKGYKWILKIISDKNCKKSIDISEIEINVQLNLLTIDISNQELIGFEKYSEYQHKILSVEHRIESLSSETKVVFYNICGEICLKANQIVMTWQNYQEAYEISKKICINVTNKTILVISLIKLGYMFFDIQDFMEAGEYYLEALNLANRYLVEHDPKIAKIKVMLGAILAKLKKYELAINYYREALNIFEQHKIAELISDTYLYIGKCYHESDNYKEALIWYKKFLEKNKLTSLELEDLNILHSLLEKFKSMKQIQILFQQVEKLINQKKIQLSNKNSFFYHEAMFIAQNHRSCSKKFALQSQGYKSSFAERSFQKLIDGKLKTLIEIEEKQLIDKIEIIDYKDTLETSSFAASSTVLSGVDLIPYSEEEVYNIDETYWYFDAEINRLLNLLVLDKQEANILLAPNSYELFIETLKRAVGLWQGEVSQQGNIDPSLPSLLPLNINFDTQEIEINQGNHWVGLFIKPIEGNKYDVYYVDSKDNSISAFLKDLIVSVLGDNLRNLESKSILQQANDSDCGPFLVDNLVNLLREKVLMQAADLNARDIRLQHADLLPALTVNPQCNEALRR